MAKLVNAIQNIRARIEKGRSDSIEREKLSLEERRLDILENNPYVTFQLNQISDLQQRLWEKTDEASKFGILDSELQNVDSSETTDGSFDILNSTKDSRDNYVIELQNNIDGVLDNLNSFYSGKNLAASMDTDISGHVGTEELLSFINSPNNDNSELINEIGYKVTDVNGQKVPSFDMDSPFYKGVQHYTLAPEKQQQLKTTALENQALGIKLSYLDQDYQDKQNLSAVNLDIASVNLEHLQILTETKKENAKQAKLQTTVIGMQIDKLEQDMAVTDFEHNQVVNEKTIATHESLLINNNQQQTRIGTSFLASIMLDKQKNYNYTPIMTPLAIEAVFLQEGVDPKVTYDALLVKNILSKRYSKIAPELYEFVTAIGIGDEEEGINDYGLVLSKFQKLINYNSVLSEFIQDNEDMYNKLSETNGFRYLILDKMLQSNEIKTKYSAEQRTILQKAQQWEHTGIFTEASINNIKQGIKSLEQEEYLLNGIENLKASSAYSAFENIDKIESGDIPLIQDSESIKNSIIDFFDKNK